MADRIVAPPGNKTYGALDAGKQADFTHDVTELMARGNRATDGTLVLPSEYLEAVIVRG